LALACSPRKNGNTAALARKALDGCQDAGGVTSYFYLTDYRYSPCRACGACNTTGKCVVKDDAEQLFEKILSCDRFILAAPIFSMGICAQAKALIDRSQQFWAAKYLLDRRLFDEVSRPRREGIYISCAGTRLSGVFEGALQVVRYFFKMLEIELVAAYCYPGIDAEGEIYKNTAAIQDVYDAGRKLAGHCSLSCKEPPGGANC